MSSYSQSIFSFLSAGNAQYLYEQYRRFLSNPHSVPEEWQKVFGNLGDNLANLEHDFVLYRSRNRSQSRQRSAHAGMGEGDFSKFVANGRTEHHPGMVADGNQFRSAILDSIKAIMLIRAYRVRGHLMAKLDPLHLTEPEHHPELDPANYGFFEGDYDRPIFLNYVLGLETSTIRDVLAILRHTYCSTIGIEFQQTQDPEQKLWLQQRIEAPPDRVEISPRDRRRSLKALVRADFFERFLAKKYTSVKRFGLEGGEVIIPLFEHVLRHGSFLGIREIVLGLAHRGRLNFITNVFRKPYRAVFSEFLGNSPLPPGMKFSGDVKYHLGVSCDREFNGRGMHISLTANPSHLEAVNTVVLGKVRAKQHLCNDIERERVMGVLVHGDASFSGQGVVAETFLMSKLYGYRTGGTLHIIINNQIGFTTNPNHSRSSKYSSDIANVVGAPIFHVNGDDIDACLKVVQIALEYRQRFKSDVVIDVICYRRHGHNEADDPFFTQPKMYKAIGKHPSTLNTYVSRLFHDNTFSEKEFKKLETDIQQQLQDEFDAADSYAPNKADWLEGQWKGFAANANTDKKETTGVDEELLISIGKSISTIPQDFAINPKIKRQLETMSKKIDEKTGIHWSQAEALALGSLLCEGNRVRLSGEDSKRGTFSQRHAVLIDQESETPYIPLNHIQAGQQNLEILDSPLSEYGVLGFEYGYATADPNTLVLWESQFGDFANGAQVVIDQFISSGEVKWLRMNGLVLLLPHGFEGQGPEHSSARLERYLQLSAEDNWRVCNITTPANYFHGLRRQLQGNIRKPLILMTPKSLLRHRACVSDLSEMANQTNFRCVLPDDAERADKSITLVKDSAIRRVVLCSGKVYYDLLAERDQGAMTEVYLARIEQLYPYPAKALKELLSRFPQATFVWCQEEPENMGAWNYIDRRLEKTLVSIKAAFPRPLCVSRPRAASPATGLMKIHLEQQNTLVNEALSSPT